MTSSMMAGERRWASARKGGMTVLGKVAVPKPLNLPSQKLENHGLDPNVEIVPKGSLCWGSRPSSSSSNPWGSSALSPNADGSTGTPNHPGGRPSSGGGISRPSTAGSDRMHESAANAWGPNSRPSSASGVLASNQSSLTSSRPRSAEPRPGSSHLSRFAEPVDNSMSWGPNGAAEKLLMPSNNKDFSLSSGDFPTLGSEKDNAGKNGESHDHGSHVRPSSASGRPASAKERTVVSQADLKSGTVDTWTRDGPPHVEEGMRPIAEKWQGEPQQYVNHNVPPQHFDAWRGPPMNAPAGVWYRGPPGGPPYPPVAHGGFPMEPFPYYRPQMPPALANSQPVPPQGPGPRGHHPKNGDFYRPQMPDAFIRPGMPIRPGFYPGPVPYDGYYGPPMSFNHNERDIPFMGMPPGPPVYNMYPPQNPSEPSDSHIRAGGHGSTGNMLVREQLDSGRPEEPRGPYKVLRKRENEWDADVEDENWEPAANSLSLEKGDQPRPSSSRKNGRGADGRRNEDMPSRRNAFVENPPSRDLGNRGHSSDSVIEQSPEAMGKSKALDDSWGRKSEIGATSFPEVSQVLPAKPKDSSLIQKIEGLNAKMRASDVREDAAYVKEEQKNKLLANPKVNYSTNEVGGTYTAGILAPPSHDMGVPTGDNTFKSTIDSAQQFSRRAHHASRVDHHGKGRLNNHEADGWRKKPSDSAVAVPNQNVGLDSFQGPDRHISMEAADTSEAKNLVESLTPMIDTVDGQAQRAKMRELAKQRAIQLQKEEEERIREQKAKALAKLEELNRRSQAADGAIQKVEKPSVPVQQDMDGPQALPEQVAASKHEAVSSDLDLAPQAVDQSSEGNTGGVGQFSGQSIVTHLDSPKSTQEEPFVSHGQSLPLKQKVANATDESKAAPVVMEGALPKQKRTGHRQKQSVQVEKNLAERSTLVGTSEPLKGQSSAILQNPGSSLPASGGDVPSPELSLPNNSNILPESTTHQRRKNNRSGKNKHKLDDTSTPAAASTSSVPIETNLSKGSLENGKPNSSPSELDPSSVLVNDSKDTVHPDLEHGSLPSEDVNFRSNNHYKPQQPRRMPRNQHARSADRFHGSDAVVWAPVRPHNKVEPGDEASQRTMQDAVPPPSKSNNSSQTNPKSKRAEMERYVPKPVAKELAQQGSIHQPVPFSVGNSTSEEMTEQEQSGSQPAMAAAGNVGPVVESKGGDGKHSKQVKSHGAWRQRGPSEMHRGRGFQQGSSSTSSPSKNYQKSLGQHEVAQPVPTETNIMHEWDPSDGWHMPECPPPEVAAVTSYVKDQGITGRGKRQTYKGQRGAVTHHDIDHKNVGGAEVDKNFPQLTASPEIAQTDRPVSSKENRSSHWQPKSQPQSANNHRGSRSSGGQNAISELKKGSPHDGRDFAPQVEPEEFVAEYKPARGVPNPGHQEGRRERRSSSFKMRPQSPNEGLGNMEDETPFEPQHSSSVFRKNGGQSNRSGGQDNRQQHSASSNRERPRQNSLYEYQPVGSNNNNNNNKFNNLDAPTDGSRNTAQRYRERGSGQSRRGGGNFYGRQGGAVRVEAGND